MAPRGSLLSRLRWRVTTQASVPTSTTRSTATKAPTSSTKPVTQTTAEALDQRQSRLDRLIRRTPKFLHRHISSLRSAPITHISAFLVLHEITAIVPLLGLAGAFHYYNWLPSYFSEGAWVVAGVERFGRYFKRKGWISTNDEQIAEEMAASGNAEKVEHKRTSKGERWWDRGEGGVRIVVEFATAYAIVKALLIPRLMLSAWGAPWFARWTIIPVTNSVKRLLKRRKMK